MNQGQIGSGGSAEQAFVAARNLTPARVDDWIDEAQPGARLAYYHGRCFAESGQERLGEHLRRQEARGLIFLVQSRRDQDGLRDYIAQRSSRPSSGDAPKRPLTLHEQARDFAQRGARETRR